NGESAVLGGPANHQISDVPALAGTGARQVAQAVLIRRIALIASVSVSSFKWTCTYPVSGDASVGQRTIPAEPSMNSLAALWDSSSLSVRLATRGDLTAFLMDLTAEIGADAYMLVAIVHEEDRNTARILASNWIHDAIELVGRPLIASLAQTPATAPGARPRSLLASQAPELPGVLNGEEAALLDVLGHREICPLSVQAGRNRYFVLFSAERIDKIDQGALIGAQMRCCYALSQIPEMLRQPAAQD